MLIRTKLRIGYLVFFVLAGCIGLALIWAVRAWHAATEDYAASHAQSLRAERLRGDLYRQIKEILDRMVSGDRHARVEFEALGVGVEERLAELRAHARSGDEMRLIEDLDAAHRRVTVLVGETFDLLAEGARDLAIQKAERELEQVAFRDQDDQINRLRAHYDTMSRRSRVETLAVGVRGQRLAGVVMLAAVLWGAGLLFGIQRWLVKPLEAIRRSTAIISTGRLDHQIRLESRDELGDVAASIDAMAHALTRIQERLRQAERLAAAGELSSYIAHNIRNPLASIRSSAQAMLKEPGVPDQVKASLASIIETVDHLGQWAHSFLFALKPITPAMAPGDLNGAIADALQIVRPIVEQKAIEVRTSLSPALPRLPLDERYMEQAILALLTNACEATPFGGSVTIISRLTPDGDGSDGVAVDIADDGKGVPHDVQHEVFTPFFTTKSGGVGLGLAMAQKIVAVHGGTLSLSNRAEGGAVARVVLPTGHAGDRADGRGRPGMSGSRPA
jgi:signal transduction histidine kinase